MKIIELESIEQLDELQNGILLLDFYATWCQPCKMMAKTLESFESTVPVVKIDVEKFNELAVKYNVRGVPKLVLTRDTEILAEKGGYQKDAELTVFIETHR